MIEIFPCPRQSFWSEEKLEAKPDQFLIITVSHVFEQNTGLSSSNVDLLPCEYLAVSKSGKVF